MANTDAPAPARRGQGALAGLLALTFATIPAWGSAQEPAALWTPPQSEESVCQECHAGVDAERLNALTHADGLTCTSCHHLGFSNRPEVIRAERAAVCAGCHEESAPVALTHEAVPEKERPGCPDCHTLHTKALEADPGVDVGACGACHADAGHPLHSDSGSDAPTCTDCHTLHAKEAADTRCGSCHATAHGGHTSDMGSSCATCHAQGDRPTRPDTARIATACLDCHDGLRLLHADVPQGAPSCLACHDVSGEEAEAAARVAFASATGTCMDCHDDVAAAVHRGGHAAALNPEGANPDLPTCTTCHDAHLDPGEERVTLRLRATVACMECHAEETLIRSYDLPEVVPSFENDFHGETVRFQWRHPDAGPSSPDSGSVARAVPTGSTLAPGSTVMICADCHGAHDVGWSEEYVLSDVCGECHDGDNRKLAQAWIGHDDVGPGNRPLIFLIKLGYYFLIPFMLLGLGIHIAFQLLTARRNGARMWESEGARRIRARLRGQRLPPEPTAPRFSVADRWEHLTSAFTFIALVVTGLPQTKPEWGAARWIIDALGGIQSTRLAHRVVGFAFVTLFLVHVARAVVRSVKGRHLPVMIPTRKDFQDILQMARHYLWGEPRPRFGKFDFGEKFEYWGLFLGGVVMSVTGLALVFPEFLSNWLPGIVVAAARVIHGFEATFAVLVVILWHSWGVMLRPEVFPLDTSIFTGRIPLSRLREEHPLEYERIVGEHPDAIGAR